MRFTIRNLMVWTLVAAIASALFAAGGPFMRAAIAIVLVINAVGAAIAWWITAGLGFPRDGGYRRPVEMPEDGAGDENESSAEGAGAANDPGNK